MQSKDFTTTILVDQTPNEVYKAINNVAAWWTGEPGVEGSTVKIGDEFTYQYKEIHYSKQRIIELIPAERIAWLVTDSNLSFISDRDEWNGTTIIFEIAKQGKKTEVRFTHAGLIKELECYSDCSNAWTSYISDSLKNFIATTKATA